MSCVGCMSPPVRWIAQLGAALNPKPSVRGPQVALDGQSVLWHDKDAKLPVQAAQEMRW